MKAVGLLISELHSQYDGTRKIAIAQLILLGDKTLPYLSAFLGKELDLENDLKRHRELEEKTKIDYDNMHVSPFDSREWHKKNDEIYADMRSTEKSFNAKWGRSPYAYRSNAGDFTDQTLISGRLHAIESLKEVFEVIGDENRAKTTHALLSDFKEYSGP